MGSWYTPLETLLGSHLTEFGEPDSFTTGVFRVRTPHIGLAYGDFATLGGCEVVAGAYTSAYMALALSMRESTVSPANRFSCAIRYSRTVHDS